ncbi:MAG: glycosyltransferase family 39 protein [Lachnospiraceae bacterium]|nr:glycosyltransferase family 39 protein [Lachnospiraceae bacterium]
MSAIIILIYSVICRFLTSLYSIRFNKVLMEVDGACFYDIGKAIVDGKILYKEVFDHKAPYIYFINALGSLIDYNHFGLFIIEILVLFFSIYYTYKILKLLFKNNMYQAAEEFSLIGAFFMSVLLTLREISFGYSRTEAFAVAFFIPAFYIFIKFIVIRNNLKDIKSKIFIIGILAGLSFMTNIKAIALFAPFAISILILLIQNKKYKLILWTFIIGLSGVIVSILPYVTYMLWTNSFEDMIYAVVNTNIAYAGSKISMSLMKNSGEILYYNSDEGIIATIIAFTQMEPLVMALIYISFILIFVAKYNKYLKLTLCLQVIIAFLYIMLSGRIQTYYLYIMMPFVISIYVLIVDRVQVIFKNKNLLEFLNKRNKVITTVFVIIVTLLLSFLNNSRYLYAANHNYVARAKKINDIVDNYKSNIIERDLKVLGLGFIPEIYVYLDAKINYKHFIVPSVAYEKDKTAYTAQYNYLSKLDPDIVVIQESQSLYGFPNSLKRQITAVINEHYLLIGEVLTNANTGSYYVYGKKIK